MGAGVNPRHCLVCMPVGFGLSACVLACVVQVWVFVSVHTHKQNIQHTARFALCSIRASASSSTTTQRLARSCRVWAP